MEDLLRDQLEVLFLYPSLITPFLSDELYFEGVL